MKQHPGSNVVLVVLGHAQSSSSALLIQWHAARPLHSRSESIVEHIEVVYAESPAQHPGAAEVVVGSNSAKYPVNGMEWNGMERNGMETDHRQRMHSHSI